MAPPKGFPKPTTSGRKPGTKNKASAVVQAIARELIDDPDYRAALRERLLAGTAGVMESLLWQYSYGRPPVTSDTGETLSSITIHF